MGRALLTIAAIIVVLLIVYMVAFDGALVFEGVLNMDADVDLVRQTPAVP